jgi:opacity protein-like surface antigen
MKKLLIASAVAMVSLSSQAQVYGELGVTFANYEEDLGGGSTAKTSPQALRGILGYELSKNVAVEAMLGFGLNDSSTKVDGETVSGLKMKFDSMYGFYVKPKIELAPNFELFGRIGYADVRATLSYSPTHYSEADSDNGLSYGVGISYHFDKRLSFNADYMSYLNKSDYSASGFTLGLGYKF